MGRRGKVLTGMDEEKENGLERTNEVIHQGESERPKRKICL